NSYRIKELLPDYTPTTAAHFHEESKDILAKAITIAKKQGKNITLDVTMNGNGVDQWIRAFKAKGYSTQAHFIHSPVDKSAVNAVRRAMNPTVFTGLHGETHFFHTGRLVPIDVIKSNKNNENVFDSIRNKVDKWSLIDNSGEGFKLQTVASGEKQKKFDLS